MISKRRDIFFLLFALSGFSGLIYESIWSHYIKLFLGHSAPAQTLVMVIFMGGMSIGSWICCRYSLGWNNLFLYYALVEAIIGIFALVFHTAFDAIVRFSFYSVIPHLSTSGASTYQWLLSALLILPQSILIGMPFPLMSAGLLREFPDNPGKSISRLYFLNSLGAAIGVLASGFLLIRMVGLPGTIRIGGAINILIALCVWFLIREKQPGSAASAPFTVPAKALSYAELIKIDSCLIYLFASFVTGASSFIYEIGWLRMLSLVLGSTTHAFELMLSAFILGLALGAAWIKRRLDNVYNPVSHLVVMQIVMGFLAVATLRLYDQSFNVMQWILKTIGRTDAGYLLFNVSSHAIAMAVMLPATFCAGTILPLITYILLKKGHGEGSIGAVYAANTIGAILGMVFAVHLGMPFFGLKGMIAFGAGLDMALGLFLLWKLSSGNETARLQYPAAAICFCAAMLTVISVHADLYKMDSGVYLNGNIFSLDNTDIFYHKDGKTATISVATHDNGFMSLRTNGKSDAAINMDPHGQHSPDEDTMVLTAVIPMALNPNARNVANIGLGTGLTTHTLLCNNLLAHVDTIEIEELMVEASKQFGDRIRLAHTDPRSRIYIDDAKSFFASHNEKYDIIISEPSHPWVSGISNLFTDEFYSMIKRHMSGDGLFVQWVQLTDTNMELIASIIKALTLNFADYDLYAANDATLLIVARKEGTMQRLDPGLLKMPEIAKTLSNILINRINDIEVRKIGGKRIMDRLLRTFPMRANSDYFPVLDQNAVKARFLNANATDIIALAHDAMPVMELLSVNAFSPGETMVTPSPFFATSKSVFIAMALRDYFIYGNFAPKYGEIPADVKQRATTLRTFFFEGNARMEPDTRMNCLYNTALNIIPYLGSAELETIWNKLETGKYARLLTNKEKDWISLFRAVGKRDGAAMAKMARILLETEQRLPLPAVQFLVATGMLGSAARGNWDESNRLWENYNSILSEEGRQKLLFRLLIASSIDRSF